MHVLKLYAPGGLAHFSQGCDAVSQLFYIISQVFFVRSANCAIYFQVLMM